VYDLDMARASSSGGRGFSGTENLAFAAWKARHLGTNVVFVLLTSQVIYSEVQESAVGSFRRIYFSVGDVYPLAYLEVT
jgi:hypothetical protein